MINLVDEIRSWRWLAALRIIEALPRVEIRDARTDSTNGCRDDRDRIDFLFLIAGFGRYLNTAFGRFLPNDPTGQVETLVTVVSLESNLETVGRFEESPPGLSFSLDKRFREIERLDEAVEIDKDSRLCRRCLVN